MGCKSVGVHEAISARVFEVYTLEPRGRPSSLCFLHIMIEYRYIGGASRGYYDLDRLGDWSLPIADNDYLSHCLLEQDRMEHLSLEDTKQSSMSSLTRTILHKSR